MKKKHLLTFTKWALFTIYMMLLFYVVFFAEGMGRAEAASGYKYNLTLFREIKRYWRYLGHFDSLGWIAFLNIIGNVLAFIPFGIFLPWLSEGRIKFIPAFICGFALSLTIETVQLIFKVGCFDVDDLVLNVVGAVCGYILYIIVHGIIKLIKKDR